MTYDKKALQEAIGALQQNIDEWVELGESGDAGFWDANETEVVKRSKAAIHQLSALIEGEKE